MIHSNTFAFLNGLSQNNNKPWFDQNKESFEVAKVDFQKFVQDIISGLAKFDKNFVTNIVDAKTCINRIYRDVRFSKDKTPYKTTFFAMINVEGRKSQKASYYLQIQPGNSFVGGGAYMPQPADLKMFRQEIDYNFKEWEAILSTENFKRFFFDGVKAYDTLSKAPKDFENDNPAIEYLKMKGYHAVANISDKTLLSENALNTILVHLKVINPMLDFLNRGFNQN
jgi:uncharacterized protein (TIGR02453 family)